MSLYHNGKLVGKLHNDGDVHGVAYQNGSVVQGIVTDYARTPQVLRPPANGLANVEEGFTATTSEFAYRGIAQTHVETHWQIASDAGFTDLVFELTSATDLLSTDVHPLDPDDSPFYIRARHRGSETGYSAWSPENAFEHATYTHVFSVDVQVVNHDSSVYGCMARDGYGDSWTGPADPPTIDVGLEIIDVETVRLGASNTTFMQFGNIADNGQVFDFPYDDVMVVTIERDPGEYIILFDRDGEYTTQAVFQNCAAAYAAGDTKHKAFELSGLDAGWTPAQVADIWGSQLGETRSVFLTIRNIPPQG